MPRNKKLLIYGISTVIFTVTVFMALRFFSKKQKIVRKAIEEWKGWGQTSIINGKTVTLGGTETKSGFDRRVGDYWSSIGLNYDGDDTDVAWSSAFISFIMKQSGVGNDFVYSASHSDYITAFIRNRKQGNLKAPFVAYRINEIPAEVGDLICYTRQGGVSYDTEGNYKSHCDIVVSKDSNSLDVIGGNVNHSVSRKTVSTDKKGNIIDKSVNWFVTIKNNL